ncbi:hypothetical protein ATKI12_3109 [Kitasatospora sp. Ki12]|uniref:hypothetical protein n=1 Tax=Kitasatospora xanthocidica TaxID=83382 RepID=UPI0016757958|nr:hypothetical protein [Kitasatospora xanthocidica]GHF57873.1 hypothetical protein GCM10018790_39590 [Kitasatospora xanthocidica]
MRMRPTAQSAGQQLEGEQRAAELRAELDELLRASRYASQRERRLNEAIRANPGRSRPDGELLRQLAQARTLREGLGARCLQISNQLEALEIRLRHEQQQEPPQHHQQHQHHQQDQHHFEHHHEPEPAPTPPKAPPPPARPDIGALTERITTLHRAGALAAEAELLDQAAARLAPADAALLVGMLAQYGPTGSSLHLARSAARLTAEHAVAVLTELRELGLAEEAAALFHAFWAYPATSVPGLLAALEQAGQNADGATLLWEWGSAPTPELTSLAACLQQHGRPGDVRTLLRQAAGRPTADLAALAAELPPALTTDLLKELTALRPPAELVRLASALDEAGSRELYGQLLVALLADGPRHRTTLAALRAAGLSTTPPAAPRSRWGWR